jgi:hypothetical protein
LVPRQHACKLPVHTGLELPVVAEVDAEVDLVD